MYTDYTPFKSKIHGTMKNLLKNNYRTCRFTHCTYLYYNICCDSKAKNISLLCIEMQWNQKRLCTKVVLTFQQHLSCIMVMSKLASMLRFFRVLTLVQFGGITEHVICSFLVFFVFICFFLSSNQSRPSISWTILISSLVRLDCISNCKRNKKKHWQKEHTEPTPN